MYPSGSIPSIRRNGIIAACLDIADLMERGGTGFQAMLGAYSDREEEKQPGVLIYPGFLDLRLFDKRYRNDAADDELSDREKVMRLLRDGPQHVKMLQAAAKYKSRSQLLRDITNPLLADGTLIRQENIKSPTSVLALSGKKNTDFPVV